MDAAPAAAPAAFTDLNEGRGALIPLMCCCGKASLREDAGGMKCNISDGYYMK